VEQPFYKLSRHIYTCEAGDKLVLLDLHRDKYFELRQDDALMLRALVRESSLCSNETEVSVLREMREELLKLGIITDQVGSGKQLSNTSAERVTDGAIDEDLRTRPTIPFRMAPLFIRSTIAARNLLRAQSLESVVTRIRRRKYLQGSKTGHFNKDRAGQLAAGFDALRPFLFSTKDACLFHSLALVEFMARHSIFPDWIFGVRANPFSAHCWVQYGAIVYNDSPERVHLYTPIMIV
jgi:hypothetical protein